MKNMEYNKIKNAYLDKGFPFYTKPYSINIFGIRNSSKETNKFNDKIGLAYVNDYGKEICETFDATTKAGDKYLYGKFGGINGTAILQTGWYKNLWKIGRHKKYKALRQHTKIEVIRDIDKDGELDYDSNNKEYGMFYINLHHANSSTTHPSTIVGSWSAGCQVIRKISDWNIFYRLVKKSASIYGDKFSYTLFDEDFIDTI